MNSMIIKPITENELETLQMIGRKTFFETFSENNTETDMKKYLEENFGTEKLRKELNNTDSFFFIAWNDQQAIGYLKINIGNAQTELQDQSAIEIERIYVDSAYHGLKAGQLLYEKALETALSLNKEYIWLAVWEENYRAMKFYEKNGFTAFDKHIFRLGNTEQTDIMMKKVL